MTDQRLIVEMGMGNDMSGQDYTKAAARAIQDAIRHSSLPILGALDIPYGDMRVEVTIAVQDPGAVDCAALAGTLPHGHAAVRAVKGGLNVHNPGTRGVIVVAAASVEVFLAPQTGWRLREA